jgi:(S)-mandelate dehydrogenase
MNTVSDIGSVASAAAESSCPSSWRARRRVLRAWNIRDLRAMAKRRLPRAVFDFFDGAAEDEITLRENRAAFERVRIAPKMLTGVERVDTSTVLLGGRSKMPIAVGPTGGIGFGWPFADVGVARAAAAAGIPYTLSTMATASIERIAREAGGRLWFQIYIFRDSKMTSGLLDRARQCGYEALMVTVDVPVGGKRERDFYNDFAIRFRFTPRNVLDFATRPLAWCLDILRHGMPRLENVAGLAPEAKSTPRSPPRSASSGTRISTETT